MWMQTKTGRKFDLTNVHPIEVDIEDIAHALSMQCRFNGHTHKFLSVAEHSVNVMALMPRTMSIDGRLAALLHDAPEAYVGDLISPIKEAMPEFKRIEARVEQAIERRFNFTATYDEAVLIKRADLFMAWIEGKNLLNNSALVNEWNLPTDIEHWFDEAKATSHLYCLSPQEAKEQFYITFESLMRERRAMQQVTVLNDAPFRAAEPHDVSMRVRNLIPITSWEY